MRVSARLAGPALAALLLLAGCPSLTVMGPARTVPKGDVHGFFALGAYRTTLVSTTSSGTERTVLDLPLFEFGARFGVTEQVDLGLRGGFGFAAVVPRFQLLRSASPDSGIDLLLETSLGLSGLARSSKDTGSQGGFGGLALALGINLGHGHQLVLAPRATYLSEKSQGSVMLLGGSLGLPLRVAGTDERPWYLVPECGSANVSGQPQDFKGPLLQCALGLLGPW
jgi:hypothetical protein